MRSRPSVSPVDLFLRALIATMGVAALSGCGPTVQVAPITIQPITITVDINIRIDRELDNFFAFQKGGSASASATDVPAATAPAASP